MYEQIDLYSLDSPPITDPKTHEEYLGILQKEEEDRRCETVRFLKERYLAMVDSQYDHRAINIFGHLRNRALDTLEEIQGSMIELAHFMKNRDYYITIERIEHGEKLMSDELDKARRDYFAKILNELYSQLNKLMPKDEAA
ncbi:hypothetical protein [Paenibacillus sinopodophylli]|uniref:hypothetical protein n=1 Tax=Paenibacillus sinopodophylli TaxID=1837342 RepID=UPI00110CA7E4|nr:hypothetical protein [Paenibacillus sinopodophylli]